MKSRLEKLARVYRATAMIVLTTALLFLAVNLVCAVVLRMLPRKADPVTRQYGHAELARAYPDLTREQVSKLLNECWAHPLAYEPYLHFRETPRRGEYVNIDAKGFRYSANQHPWPPDPKEFNVFVFGGSTTFGYGVSDAQTVPSLMGKLMSERLGTNVCIYNFGRSYYQITQERILFEQLLVGGFVPRMAIFMDGLNDFYFPDGIPQLDTRVQQQMLGSVATPEQAGGLSGLPAVRLVQTLKERNTGEKAETNSASPQDTGLDADAAAGVCARYLKNMGLIDRIAAGYGVQTWFVWQPVPTYKYDTQYHLFAEGLGKHWRSKTGYETMASLRQQLGFPVNFLWCADIQEGATNALYVDAVHYSPAMCQRLGAEIVRQMGSRMQKQPDGTGSQ